MSAPKCIQSHNAAITAKWMANTLLRIRGINTDEKRYATSAARQYSLAEIADRLISVCYVNTPDATPEAAGALFNVTILSPLNLYHNQFGLYGMLINADGAFDWRSVHYIINELQQTHLNLRGGELPFSKDHFARFTFTWTEREAIRLACGHYQQAPWEGKGILKPIKDHFVHVSEQQGPLGGLLLAYTADADKGERDIQTRIKPGRYLKQFYPDLSDEQIRDLQAMVGTVNDVRITQDPDEIERVYTDGPESCMSGDKSRWGGNVSAHPTRAYGGGDLAVAYLVGKNGRPNARSVVWPEKKLYHKIYGDSSRLGKRLAELGYKQGGSFCFEGAKMRRMPNAKVRGSVLIPHFDGHGQYDVLDENFLVVRQSGGYVPDGSGYMNIPEPVACGCGCGGKGPERNMPALNLGKGRERWLRACYEKAKKDGLIGECQVSGNWYRREDLIEVHYEQGRRYKAGPSYRQQNCIRCANGEWYDRSRFNFFTMPDGNTWERNYFTKNADKLGYRRDNDGLWVVNEQTTLPLTERAA